MRAKFVNEEVNFERGKNPKEGMGIGVIGQIENAVPRIQEIDTWNVMNHPAEFDGTELEINTYPGDDCSDHFENLLDQLGIGEFFDLTYADETQYEFQLKPEYREVNEAQNFERGKSPKSSMDIGGINLGNEFEERVEELKMRISGEKVTSDEEWYNYVHDLLVGKRITAVMATMPKMDIKTKKMQGKRESGKFTVEVLDIQLTDNLSDIVDSSFQRRPPNIIVADTEKNLYELRMDQKIHFN